MADYEDQKYPVNGYYDEEANGYDDEVGEEITSEDCWKVIGSFFESKGLCSMQIESFNEFMRSSMQDLVNEVKTIILDHAENVDEEDPNPIVIKRHEVTLGTLTLSSPNITEGEGTTADLLPHEARLRSLTYSSPVYCKMSRTTFLAREKPWPGQTVDDGAVGDNGMVLFWQESGEPEDSEPDQDIFIGKVPIMIKSSTCHLLNDKRFSTERDLHAWGECPYDQGGYFIINGSEKVLIAQ